MYYFQLITGIIFRCDNDDFATESNTDNQTTFILSKAQIVVKDKTMNYNKFVNVTNAQFDKENVAASWIGK